MIITQDLRRYLGVPILHKRVTKHTYAYLIKRKEKVEGWNDKYLSLVGKLTLTQSILNALPTYTMQAAWLPMHILAMILIVLGEDFFGELIMTLCIFILSLGIGFVNPRNVVVLV